jgi:chromodomain-helicase-DNA-binding protein 1
LGFQHRQKEEPEEYEKYKIEREMEKSALADYQLVERVIGSRQGDEGTEYFVKCMRTWAYDDALYRC